MYFYLCFCLIYYIDIVAQHFGYHLLLNKFCCFLFCNKKLDKISFLIHEYSLYMGKLTVLSYEFILQCI